MRATKPQITLSLLLMPALALSSGAAPPEQPGLTVGWHDEMNLLNQWQPLRGENEPDVFAARPGAMTLRLPHVPQGFPHLYQWGGVTRRVSVDLGRYPILVAYVSRVQDGSYAHLDVEERDNADRPVRSLRTPTLQGRGLSVLDVGQAWGPHTRRMHLRLIVGGSLSGASCEYSWVRFVRREDVPGLKNGVNRQNVTLKP